jgi:hypothetical protein
MPVVTVRVDDAVKAKMERLKDVDWNEVARKAFEKKIFEAELWRPVDVARMKSAVASTDTLRGKIRQIEGWDSTEEVRRWRERDRR